MTDITSNSSSSDSNRVPLLDNTGGNDQVVETPLGVLPPGSNPELSAGKVRKTEHIQHHANTLGEGTSGFYDAKLTRV